MRELRGANALVTGAAGGLGHYISRALADEGANVALSDRPQAEEALDALAEELRRRGVLAEPVAGDLEARGQVEGLVESAEQALGPIDVLVNNAGLEFGGAFLATTLDELEAITKVNLLALMILTRQALPGMLERGRGHVVNVASLAGKAPPRYLASYAATKHGVVGFTHSLRSEYIDSPVGFSAICPAYVGRVGMYGRLEDRLPDPPPGLGPVQPERVGEAVVTAIREDRAELIIGSLPLRALTTLYALAPKLVVRMFDNRRSREFSDEWARARGRLL
jgi:short-subunit dehydrogenase